MLELFIAVMAIVAMCRIASADDQSPIIWGAVTFLLVFGSFFIPMPFLRIGLAFVLALVAMIGYKLATDR